MKSLFLSIILVFVVTGCASPKIGETEFTGYNPQPSDTRRDNWQKMVGNWYGELNTKDGGKYYWIIRRNIEGEYMLKANIVAPDGTLTERVEVGQWGVGARVYFLIYRGWLEGGEIHPSDPSDPYNTDIYNIISITENRLEYQHTDHGRSYSVRKVNDDFELPKSL